VSLALSRVNGILTIFFACLLVGRFCADVQCHGFSTNWQNLRFNFLRSICSPRRSRRPTCGEHSRTTYHRDKCITTLGAGRFRGTTKRALIPRLGSGQEAPLPFPRALLSHYHRIPRVSVSSPLTSNPSASHSHSTNQQCFVCSHRGKIFHVPLELLVLGHLQGE
jgi:hypothetical protein